MKSFILCGGMGSRLDSEGTVQPKPLVKIGNEAVLIHIMKIYSKYGINDFVLCLGYKGKMIKEYFLKKYKKKILIKKTKNNLYLEIKLNKKIWKIFFVETKNDMGTGGRLRYAYKKLNLDEDILMTYGDGVADINIKKLIDFHYKTELLSSMSIVYAPYRYGIVKIKKNLIEGFNNRKKEMINGGFFVISKKAIKYIKKDSQYWESEPLEKIISLKKLGAYKHYGYWGSLDTLKDKKNLNELWFKKKAPWKT